MKNIIKTAWSLWTKQDKFVAVFSTIGIILLMCILCTSCNAQTNSRNIEYYDLDNNHEMILADNHGIMMFADGIIDFVYEINSNRFLIEYDDPDAFDIDYMMYDKEDDYYYIEIDCDSNTFFGCFKWYMSLSNKSEEFYEASDKYFIVKDTFDNGEPYYKLMSYELD